jgi:hypothetical protein
VGWPIDRSSSFIKKNSVLKLMERTVCKVNITDAPTSFGISAPSSGSFDIAFAKVINY